MKPFLLLLTFMGVLPASLALLRPVGHKYYLIKTKLTWPDAQNYCRMTYADLAMVESGLDWLRLKEELKRENYAGVAWVGLYNDFDTWQWSYNDLSFRNTYVLWFPGQPDNLGGGQSCCSTGPFGYWWDSPCEDLLPFICYTANNNYANRYVGVETKMNWNEAKAYCREFHTDLAFALTATNNNAMQAIAFHQSTSWIGGYRHTWKWSDGANTSNVLWLTGQPDNYFPDENCGVLDQGSFRDKKCTNLNYFICHITHPVSERQMMSIQVKSDSSPLDSGVPSAILELIKQKLNENGMLENTTVTWRVPSDGQTFRRIKTHL